MNKAHVQHAVGLVQHQDFQGIEIHLALLVQVQQPPGGGDQNIDALAQSGYLRVDLDPTKHDRRFEREVGAIGVHTLGHLGGQFPGGCNDQGAYPVGVLWAAILQTLQDGQGEAGSLAGAGLGRCHHIAASQHGRNGLHLYGRGLGIAFLLHRAQQRCGQTQLIKCHGESLHLQGTAEDVEGHRVWGCASYTIAATGGIGKMAPSAGRSRQRSHE